MWAKKHAVGKEEVAKLVEDTYRKMQVSGATDLATKRPSVSDTSNVKPKEEIDDPFQSDSKTRCSCGSSLLTDSMIKCDDPRCRVWQRMSCVIIPEKPMEGDPPHPDRFYCEICRLGRADPFWVTVSHPLYPVKLNTSNILADGVGAMKGLFARLQLKEVQEVVKMVETELGAGWIFHKLCKVVELVEIEYVPKKFELDGTINEEFRKVFEKFTFSESTGLEHQFRRLIQTQTRKTRMTYQKRKVSQIRRKSFNDG